MNRILMALFLIFFSVTSFATNNFQCTPYKSKIDGKNIILNAELPKEGALVYLFQNNSKKSLWLDHPTKKMGASAGWSSYLRKGNWSALVVNRKDFSISCAVIQPGHADNLNCSQVISICKPYQVAVSKRKGTYWLVEDKSWDAVVAVVTNKIK